MSLFSRILSVHEEWLNQKGYNEKMLDSGEKNGAFLARLKEAFGKAVSQSLWDDLPRVFTVDVQGCFSEKQVKLDFEFRYQYHPRDLKLDLKSVTVSLKDVQQVYDILLNTRRSLPESGKVYQQLLIKSQHLAASRLSTPRKSSKEPGSRVSLK